MALQTGIAACETGNAYERETALASGSHDYDQWRQYVLWGEVHDGNAYFLGGVAGHAGLFSTASETHRLALVSVAPERIIERSHLHGIINQEYDPGRNSAFDPWQLRRRQNPRPA